MEGRLLGSSEWFCSDEEREQGGERNLAKRGAFWLALTGPSELVSD